MEGSETATRDMAEDCKSSELSSVASLSACKEEAICVNEGILIDGDSKHSEDEVDGNLNGTNCISSDASSSADQSVIDQLKIYKALQTYALSNILKAHHHSADDNSARETSEEETVSHDGDVNGLVTAQSYLNMALYRHMLSNVMASQSPYMSLIGSLLSNIRTVAGSTDKFSEGDSQSPELTISKGTSNAVVSLDEDRDQESSVENLIGRKSSSQERTTKRTNKAGKVRARNQGISVKRFSSSSSLPELQSEEENVKEVARDNVSCDLEKLASQRGVAEKVTTTSSAYPKRKSSLQTTSAESVATDAGINTPINGTTLKKAKRTSSDIVQESHCLEKINHDKAANTLKTLKKFRKVSTSRVPELETTSLSNQNENDVSVAIPNTKKQDFELTSTTATSDVSLSQPLSDDNIPLSAPRRKYKKRQKKIDEIDKEKNKFSCSVCGKRFKLETSVTKHMWLHTGQQPYACSICDKKFTEKSNLTTHMRIHTGDKPHVCSICGRRFTQQASLMYHTRSHTGEKPYECNVCNKAFVSSSGLNSHMISHSTYKPFKCDVCNNCFARKTGLDLHMMVHTGEKPFECKDCGKLFTQRGALTSHIKQHTGDRRFHCEVCGKTFVDNCTLKKHLRIHSGDLPYQCELCGKRFLHRTSYIEHMKVHNDVRTYPCPVCGKLFRNKSSVNTHMVTHTKEKPYKCEECLKTFALKSNLKHHMKIHMRSREFVCEVCGKAFLFKDTLREHFKTHTGEKTYNCQICGKGYMWKPSFLRHMDEIHGLNPEDNWEGFANVRGGCRDEFDKCASEDIESVLVGGEQSNDSDDESVTAFESVDVLECSGAESSSEKGVNDVDNDIIEESELSRTMHEDFGDGSAVRIKEEDEKHVEHEDCD